MVMILQITSLSVLGTDNGSVNRAPLQILVAQAGELDGRDYTNASWRTFLLALKDAEAVLADLGATQAGVDEAYAALQSAVGALVPIASFGNPFTDVARGDWFYGAVLYANANALMQGTAATAFHPQGTLSRGTVVTVLYRMEGEPYVTFTPLFQDVPAGLWYSDAVIWAANQHIVTGLGDDRFAPDASITREQLTTMLYRYAQFKEYDMTVPASFDLGSFTDQAQVSSWAYEAMRWAVYHELIRGNDGRLSPGGTASRAEYATMLQRFIDKFEFGRLLPTDPQPEQRYISWQFLTYLEPDFRAAKQESFPPQSVNILQRQDDGWGQITTWSGDRWVYLLANMRYVEKAVYLYDRPVGSRGDRIEPQVVTVLHQEGDWYQISTWLGPKWIYLGVGPQPGGRQIALTFDDGPSVQTIRLLDALYARNVSATFFVLGQQVAAFPAVAQRIVREGHEIANHSYSHPDLSRMSAAGIREQLARCRSIIYQTTGQYPSLLRPPYGSHNSTVQSVAGEFGYPLILWSVDTRDWESRNVNAILGHFVAPDGTVRIRDGDIILMHDIYPTTIDAAIRAIDILLANGFEFVTISDLLTARYGAITPGKVYNR